ncbi:Aste57867_1932 [Aphanomyces stellatus]|uniref:Aste57867_1932 protein n=1 Tax=Aphanomyces stellatus TaxID=120398 RepID=A0A485KBJ0_9STRA|nr:hypothetical protein As57867_001930 [Aphanomyces stellatus]VFT79137.1 Aste57867_1932 [Aphanomyces stellatus]
MPQSMPLYALVLANHGLFLTITSFQDGVDMAIRDRYHHAATLVFFEPESSFSDSVYILPPTFPPLVNAPPPDAWMRIQLSVKDLCLHPCHRDTRLPLHLAIFEGNLDVVQRILAYRPRLLSRGALGCAVRMGHMYLVEYFISLNLSSTTHDEDSATHACAHGHGDNVEALLDMAAFRNDLPLMHLLHDHSFGPATSLAMDYAIAHGHVGIVRFLHEHGMPGPSEWKLWDAAVANGHVDVLEYLFDHRTDGFTGPMLPSAARNHQWPMLQCLVWRLPNEQTTLNTWQDVALAGNVAMLDFLLAERGVKGSLGCWGDVAALGESHMPVLQWLQRVHGRPGRLHRRVGVTSMVVVEFLYRVGTPLRKVLPLALPVAMFLYAHGTTTFSVRQITAAAQHGAVNIVQFIHANAPRSKFTKRAMNVAAAAGHLDMVQFLHVNRHEGCTHHALDDAAGNGHLAVVQFLVQHRTEGGSTAAMDKAAAAGHIDVVEYLYNHTTRGCTQAAVSEAALGGHVDVVHFLGRHRVEGCTGEVFTSLLAPCNVAIPFDAAIMRILYGYFPQPIEMPGFPTLGVDNALDAAGAACLQWLFDQEAQLSDVVQVLQLAADFGHPSLAKYIVQHRLVNASEVTQAMRRALHRNNVETLRGLWDAGKGWVETQTRLRQGRYIVAGLDGGCMYSGPWGNFRAVLEREFHADELCVPIQNMYAYVDVESDEGDSDVYEGDGEEEEEEDVGYEDDEETHQVDSVGVGGFADDEEIDIYSLEGFVQRSCGTC